MRVEPSPLAEPTPLGETIGAAPSAPSRARPAGLSADRVESFPSPTTAPGVPPPLKLLSGVAPPEATWPGARGPELPGLSVLLSLVEQIAQGQASSRTRRATPKIAGEADASAPAGGQASSTETRSGRVSFERHLYRSPDGRTELGVQAHAEGAQRVTGNSYEAWGRAEARAGFRTRQQGRIAGQWGAAEGSHEFRAEARATAEGVVKADRSGLWARGRMYAGVAAEQELQGRIRANEVLNINGASIRPEAAVKATGKAGAWAYAETDAAVTPQPPQAVVSGKAGAFAGARASVEGQLGVGPAKVKGSAEAWAGVGAEAHFDVGMRDGKLRFDFGAGAAYGVGYKCSWGFEIDPAELAKLVGGEGLAGLVGGLTGQTLTSGGGGESAGASTHTGKSFAPSVFATTARLGGSGSPRSEAAAEEVDGPAQGSHAVEWMRQRAWLLAQRKKARAQP